MPGVESGGAIGASEGVEGAGDSHDRGAAAVPSFGLRGARREAGREDCHPQLWTRRRGDHALLGDVATGGRGGGEIAGAGLRGDRVRRGGAFDGEAAATARVQSRDLRAGDFAECDFERGGRPVGPGDGLR